MNEELAVLKGLFDENILKILDLLINNETSDFYLREIAIKASVPPASTYRSLNKLVDLKIVDMRQIKKLKLYKIADTKEAEFLKKIIKQEAKIDEIFAQKAKELPGVDMVVIHGKAQKNKANILVIGSHLPKDDIIQICSQIKEEYDFTISALTLTFDQYEQMTSMGLYSGEKKVLYRRQN